MLAASIQLPNTETSCAEHLPDHMRPTPTPQNWCGVVSGMQQARLHITSGQDQQAVDVLKEVLEFAPSEADAWNLLAEILQQHGLTQQANGCSQKAVRLKQHSTTEDDNALPSSIRLAKLLWAQGDADAAHAMLNTLLEAQSDDQDALLLQQSWQQQVKETHA